jgi:hypothetical protein
MVESVWKMLLESFRTQMATWIVGVLIALLTVFSSKLVESVKFGLNKADLRAKNYEELSMDLSEFMFSAEISHEFLSHNWTTRDSFGEVVKDYNRAITNIRKKQYVYMAWLTKYWPGETVGEFKEIFDQIRSFDGILHELNDELEMVNILKTKERIDPARAEEAAARMEAILRRLSTQTRSFLLSLQQ